jgi:glycosyltransferase involved in cell wall biosynthesis
VNSPLLVSIVITTKNEEKNIQTCLESIQGQAYRNIEIIVVDNFSTDRTQEIARQYTGKVFSKGPERSSQRNYGMIDIAQGEYVMFVDADMILAPGLIGACVRRMQAGGCLALHIREIVLGVSFLSKVRRFERAFYDGTAVDGARFFLKQAFVQVGGFDAELFKAGSGEDWDIDKLIKRIGTIILLDESLPDDQSWTPDLFGFINSRGVAPSRREPLIYHNEADFVLSNYLKKKAYYAKGFDAYIAKWGQSDPDIRKQFGLWYRYFGVFLENGKWSKLLAHPLLSMGMYVLRFLVGVVYVLRKQQA